MLTEPSRLLASAEEPDMLRIQYANPAASRDPLADLMAMAAEYPSMAPLRELVKDGEGGCYLTFPHVAPRDAVWPDGGNVVVFAGLDHGPTDYPGCDELLKQCEAAAVLECENPGAYIGAAEGARAGVNVAIVECTPAFAPRWLKFCKSLDLATVHIEALA